MICSAYNLNISDAHQFKHAADCCFKQIIIYNIINTLMNCIFRFIHIDDLLTHFKSSLVLNFQTMFILFGMYFNETVNPTVKHFTAFTVVTP